jgi:hypothetical protein
MCMEAEMDLRSTVHFIFQDTIEGIKARYVMYAALSGYSRMSYQLFSLLSYDEQHLEVCRMQSIRERCE